MKKILSILAVSFLMMGMVACDVIDEQDYIKNNGGTTPPEQPSDPSEPGNPGEPEQPGNFTTSKCVLLEDYTGVRCSTCPAAGEIALDIQKQYGHSVVVLGVHAGRLAMVFGPNSGYPNFKTTDGDAWFSYFNFDFTPSGTVNRKDNGGVYLFSSTEWADAVASTLQEECTVAMASNVEYDEASRNLKVDISSKALVELPDTYSLTVCIMEDSIVGKQEGMGDNYVHRHVFRKTLNGTWGEELNTTALAPEDQIKKSYSVTLDEAYNADQCYIIAYVANSETKEVLQVIEKKIK